ncbi:hypothetical protein AVEN_140997-1 [Araneus ventricosus]|uniref:Uncharacterized protein n=1 Tax=Araneus ventricosus TaxID=182803 RepID=A0A4Y2VJ21_ARAVE|nr:hypothetical protein AVEN_55157-1 [Araneus ventricosus]GBO20185.1 hypothetical protein AVEN_268790-1 [Araneus ventricosus]GBO24176.1 hypothetical protein AVEN_234003-1 [Araneus ventricosus]GBO24177.1 hypothetical protein AVEN_140997-1 [Araneus ventricosus]
MGRGDLVVRSQLRDRKALGSKSDSTEDPSWCTPWVKRLLASVLRELPAQVSSSSSDHGSKLGSPSQHSPRVASKRGVNMTKLNRPLHARRVKNSLF